MHHVKLTFRICQFRKPRTTDLRLWLWGTALAGSPEHLPREIAGRGVHKALTEMIISQGESPRLRTGRSVVRGKQRWEKYY